MDYEANWVRDNVGIDFSEPDVTRGFEHYLFKANNARGRLDLFEASHAEAWAQTIIEYDPFAPEEAAKRTLSAFGHPEELISRALTNVAQPPKSLILTLIPQPRGLAAEPVAKFADRRDKSLPRCEQCVTAAK